jgi:hypothetical protein
MDAVENTEAHARQIQRDIERTREEMDQTLSALEEKLAPSEILHQGAETVRERLRTGVSDTVDTLKRHPAPIALAAALIGARIAFRPSAADLRQRQAEQDIERAWTLIGAAFEKAKDSSQASMTRLQELGRDAIKDPARYAGPAMLALQEFARLTGEGTWRTVQRAGEESRLVSRALRREAAAAPLGAFVVLGLGAAMALLGARGLRALRSKPRGVRYGAGVSTMSTTPCGSTSAADI